MCYNPEIISVFKNIPLSHSGDQGEFIRIQREKEHYLNSSSPKNMKNKGENNGMYGRIPANAKSVLQYSISGEFIREYPSIAAAKRVTGINNIYYVCVGQRPSAGGFIWKFGNNKYSDPGKKVLQFTGDGTYIMTYNSAHHAAKELHLDASSIYKVCQGKANKCGGFIWKFETTKE